MKARTAWRALAKRTAFGVSTFFLLTTLPTTASGEWFADLYAGASFSQKADVSVEEFAPAFTPASAQRAVGFDPSITYGGRFGYWFKWVPWVGLAVDASVFRAEGQGVDIDVVPLSGLLMFRWPLLMSIDAPHGRLQPYVGIGGGLFIIPDLEVDFRPALTEKASTSSGNQNQFGLDARAGLAWQLHRNIVLFAEYRFTHVGIEIDEKRCVANCVVPIINTGPQPQEQTQRTTETTLNTHHLLVGVSFRF